MRTQVVRGWIIGLLAVLAMMMAVSPARAHAELESSDPEDGAVLASAPAELSFIFGEQILEEGNAITLTAVQPDGQGSGTRLDLAAVTVDGDTVSVPWPDASPAGDFRAAYRVVSADGHPINGTITFTVQSSEGGTAASTPSGSVTPEDPSASASAPSASVSTPSASPAPAESEDAADAGVLFWVIGIGLAVLIGAGAGAWVMRRTR